MKNFKDNGDRLTFLAPSGGVTSGAPIIIGDLLVIPATTEVEGEEFVGEIIGKWELAAVSGDVADAGDICYWNDTLKVVTLDAATGANKLIGVYGEAKTDGMVLVDVRLNGVTLGLEA